MAYVELVRQRRCCEGGDCRLIGTVTLAFVVLLANIGLTANPATADDGSLEIMKGGLFHRKGFISPEIYRRKEAPRNTSSATTSGNSSSSTTRSRTSASSTSRTPRRVASRTSTTRTRPRRTTRSPARAKPRPRRLPSSVVQHAERNVTRSAKTPELPARATPGQPVEAAPEQPAKEIPELPVKVASLTTTVPSSSQTTDPKESITGGSARIEWIASSRCLTARLKAAINYVARNYGRVRVNSTCRSRRHNRRVGGASRSYHIGGRAADIRVFGNVRAAARYLRRVAGGYKHYGGGLFHIDTGPKRSW